MPKQNITPTASHSGGTDGTNVAGVRSSAVLPTSTAIAIPNVTRAHVEAAITGPGDSYGQVSFMGAGADGYKILAVLKVNSAGPNTVGQDVSVPAGTTTIIANIDSLSKNGATVIPSITY